MRIIKEVEEKEKEKEKEEGKKKKNDNSQHKRIDTPTDTKTHTHTVHRTQRPPHSTLPHSTTRPQTELYLVCTSHNRFEFTALGPTLLAERALALSPPL